MTSMASSVALAVMDIQTLHRGHNNLLNEMRMACDRAIVGIGSVRKSGTPGHPFSFEARAEMVRRIHGDFFDFVPLDDIDASYDITAWYGYVSSKIAKAGLPEPTDYFGGSQIDAKWYFHAFASPDCPEVAQAGSNKAYRNPKTGKRLHLVDRQALGLPSGREIRLLIETRDAEWKRYVPERLHRFVEERYPPHLRQPLRLTDVHCRSHDGSLSDFSPHPGLRAHILTGAISIEVPGDHPVGTRLDLAFQAGIQGCEDEWPLLELKDDGRWRPLETRDEKAEWAQANGGRK